MHVYIVFSHATTSCNYLFPRRCKAAAAAAKRGDACMMSFVHILNQKYQERSWDFGPRPNQSMDNTRHYLCRCSPVIRSSLGLNWAVAYRSVRTRSWACCVALSCNWDISISEGNLYGCIRNLLHEAEVFCIVHRSLYGVCTVRSNIKGFKKSDN